MLPSFQFSTKYIDSLLENRYFQFVLWTIAVGMVTLIGVLMLHGTVQRVELALQDWKMRYRTSIEKPETTPSKDIVILGYDGNTDQYTRTHPEYGLTKPAQRDRLAKVLNYLTDQGVKAVIFDLEFKDPKPAEDTALINAIRRNGHVYAASRMDSRLAGFMKEQLQAKLAIQDYDQQQFFRNYLEFDGLYRPYLNYLFNMRSRLMPLKSVGILDIGQGPYYKPLNQNMEAMIKGEARALNYLYQAPPSSFLFPLPKHSAPLYSDFTERSFSHWCFNNNYVQRYANNLEFLRYLNRGRLNVELDKPLPETIEKHISNCYTFPTIPGMLSALAGLGASSVEYDDDAYIRSVPAIYRGYKGNLYTYLGIRPVVDLLGIHTLLYNIDYLMLNDRRIPLLDGQKVLINWKSPKWMVKEILQKYDKNIGKEELDAKVAEITAEFNNPLLNGGHIYRQISLIDVLRLLDALKTTNQQKLESEADQELLGRLYNIPFNPESKLFSFKDKIVVIGDTLTDIHRTPMSNTMFGPEVIAAALDMFLHDKKFVEHVPWWMQWSLVGVIGVGIAIIVVSFENLAIGFSIGVIMVLIYWLINGWAFVDGTFWGYPVLKEYYALDLFLPTVALVFAQISATLYRYYIHDQEKHHLTNVFSKYVSPQIMSEIMRNPEHALENLKGGKKELTVLFSDLQGFTHQFENADPELMVNQLNEYFDVMTEIILSYGGTYDKYMGDSIMAFFGAPADVPAHAEMACRAAMEMQSALEVLNANWVQEGSKQLSHGIGISSGEMFVGNFGSRNIKNFTVMGSNVNLGARLEAYTRIAHWPVIISERTWNLAKDQIKVRDLGRIQVKGFTDSVQIYGLEDVVAEAEDARSKQAVIQG